MCFRPQNNITRGQTAKVAVNAFFSDDSSNTCASPPPVATDTGPIITDTHCGMAGTTFKLAAGGFEPGESVSVYMTAPGGDVHPVDIIGGDEVAGGQGIVGPLTVQTGNDMPGGISKVTVEGATSHFAVSTYYKIVRPGPNESGPCDNIPASQNMAVEPTNCGPAGTTFEFTGTGFQPGESVGMYVTAPDGAVIGSSFEIQADEQGTVSGVYIRTNASFPQGMYVATMEGLTSKHVARGYFKLLAP
jgi:Fe2+ transport system protein FeoA